jgi:hypothetical protein
LKKAITGDLKHILHENESNVSPSNQNLKPFKLQETYKLLINKDISMRKYLGKKIGLPLKTIFELPYKWLSNISTFVIGFCKSKTFDHDLSKF